MPVTIRCYTGEDRESLMALASDPSLAHEAQRLISSGELRDPQRHPYVDPRGVWLAESDRDPVGFAVMLRLPSKRGDYAVLRLGVREPFRRRGIGRALVGRALARLRESGVAPHFDLCASHWLPGEDAVAFVRAMGFSHDRYFWTMERPGRSTPAVGWPAGIRVAGFDSSERAFLDWNDCLNASFADNACSATSTLESCRHLAEAPHFDASGLLLAYRGERCVGFCLDALHAGHGEVDTVGVAPQARGIGLGRALLRWGVAWLIEHDAPRVQLMVDGENETALALYRSEGFEVVRSREAWRRPVGTAG